jgi:hypothetical protein
MDQTNRRKILSARSDQKGTTYHVPSYVFGVSDFGFSPFLNRLKAPVDRAVNP